MNDDIASTNIIYTIREANARVTTVTNADVEDSLDILQTGGQHARLSVHQDAGQGPGPPGAGGQHESQCHRPLRPIADRRSTGHADLAAGENPGRKPFAGGHRRHRGRYLGAGPVPDPDPQTGSASPPSWCWPAPRRSWIGSTAPSESAPIQGPHKGPVVVLGGGRVGQSVADALKAAGSISGWWKKRPASPPGRAISSREAPAIWKFW
jgi:hypothetical protein